MWQLRIITKGGRLTNQYCNTHCGADAAFAAASSDQHPGSTSASGEACTDN
ncbi:hypothetical protein GZ177_03890 [Dermatophilus congolensis]|uniref:hypothetical protein n=1 Tax=Dermatophilus congolensis TaxID=1863 RepID=UPI001AB04B1B|nr:hypothetical protein [Dermatophilus congolensis]MBO3203451.1 hypothetical protein [Dermatophilus congolensis]